MAKSSIFGEFSIDFAQKRCIISSKEFLLFQERVIIYVLKYYIFKGVVLTNITLSVGEGD